MTDSVALRYGMLRWWSVGLAAMLAVVVVPEARACSVCGCGDPLLAASDPAAIAGMLRLQVDTEHLGMTAGSDERTGYVDHLSQWSYRLNVAYRPLSRLALVATLPLLDKTIRSVGAGTDEVSSHLTGPGDVELAGRYAVWRQIDFSRRRVQEIALSLGTAFPTGSSNAQTTDGGAIVPVDPHGQLGTGGWGPFAGIHYRLEQGDWLGYADASYRLRTTANFFDHSTYKFGEAVLGGLHAQYRPLPRLVVDLGVDARFARVDKAAAPDDGGASTVPNTGGSVFSAAPGVYVNAVGRLWLFGRAQLPFYQDLRGEQDVGVVAAAGLQYELL
jgi:hypothetical protein